MSTTTIPVTNKLEIADRVSAISVSSTFKVSADAEKLRQQGIDVVDFGAGEPDFPTPDNIKQAAVRAIETNFTKYTAAGGTLKPSRQSANATPRISAPATSPPNASSASAASTSSSM